MKSLNHSELAAVHGGEPITGLAAAALVAGAGAGVFIGGALLAYGTVRLIQWAFE